MRRRYLYIAAEAAVKTGGKVIGVDTDQKAILDVNYGEGITITSAMKGLSETVTNVLTDIKDGKWSDHAGKIEVLGMISENAEENYVQLPIESTQWADSFTEDDYRELVRKIYSGEIKVSDDITKLPETEITVNDYDTIK